MQTHKLPKGSGGEAPRLWRVVDPQDGSKQPRNDHQKSRLSAENWSFLFDRPPVGAADGGRQREHRPPERTPVRVLVGALLIVQVGGPIRNSSFRLRVWIVDGRFGTVSELVRGSRPPQSRGASPPDPSRNLWVCTQKRSFRCLTLRNQRFRVSISYSEVS